MSIEVGFLELLKRDGKPNVLLGEINMAGLAGEIAMGPVKVRRDPVNSPHMEIQMKGPRGWYEAGKAWKKDFTEGGGYFYSLTFDGPQMEKPIYVAAFPDEDQPKDTPKGEAAQWTLKWGRPRGNRRSVMPDDGGASLNDEIPF